MNFKYDFYDFQKTILEVFENEIKRGDKKIHIVSPPGSGKTVVGIEMINRIGGNCIILVPNITLQYQWKDKINSMFLEENENINELVSTSINEIKKINILTYQSISQIDKGVGGEIDVLKKRYEKEKEEFNNLNDFSEYIDDLKDSNPEEYERNIKYYKSKIKFNDISESISENCKKFINLCIKNGINSIVLDESHHLTNWWSKVVYHIWHELKTPYVIGLTATPPYDDIDFFELDEDYSNLLGEVDYYIPTPAVVKSGLLAPYSDLVYFVQPEKSVKEIIDRRENMLMNFIHQNKEDIESTLIQYIEKDKNTLLNKKYNILKSILRYLHKFSEYENKILITEEILINPDLDDISVALGRVLYLNKGNNFFSINFKPLSKLMYELGYIRKSTCFVRFRSPVEKILIYSKSKIHGIIRIIENELLLGKALKCAIITDFLDETEDYINCKYILKELSNHFKHITTRLVSGQGIWRYNDEYIEIKSDILKETELFEKGETHILIGTRGILGEGWDCPKLDCLIDLTGISSYMSVNQVRGRGIRLDKENPKKVSNIYDIVCITGNYKGKIDFERLKRKHEKFYGVDDSGLIIRGVNHIFPNISSHLGDINEINKNMIQRVSLREYYHKLWRIGESYLNQEQFGLNLDSNISRQIVPNRNISPKNKFLLLKYILKTDTTYIKERETHYQKLIKDYLYRIIGTFRDILIELGELGELFDFEIIETTNGNYKLIGKSSDELEIKKFITIIHDSFTSFISQKYILKMNGLKYDSGKIKEDSFFIGLNNTLSSNISKREILDDKIKKNLMAKINPFVKINLSSYMPWIVSKPFLFTYGVFYAYIFSIGKGSLFFDLYDHKFKDFGVKIIKLEEKGHLIGKKPFISSNIEKIWM